MMKNMDIISRRILSFSFGISAILLSGSIFIFSLKSIQASRAEVYHPDKSIVAEAHLVKSVQMMPADSTILQAGEDEVKAIQAFGIGIREGNLYFGILYNNNSIGLHKSDADSEDVLAW